MKKKSKRKYYDGYDAPKAGWRRWTVHVNIDLFERFKKQVAKENKTLAEATGEAIKGWLDYGPQHE